VNGRLRQARTDRRWTKSQLIVRLRAAARRRGETLVSDASISRRIAAWENEGATVGDFYRELLCEVYSLTAADLGLVEPPPPALPASSTGVEITERALTLSRLDGGLVELLRAHTQSIRMRDRRLGGATIYQQTAAHVEQIERLVRYALPGKDREAAADELGQAAALAGWQALDMGRLDDAWRLHEIATAAGRESGQPSGLAYARAQQAYVLLDAHRPADAQAVIQHAHQEAGKAVPAVLRAWLHAAEGEALAADGQRDRALRALDSAAQELDIGGAGDDLPFLMLDAGHLARWRGHCRARLGDEQAILDLTSALDAMGEGRYGRAEAGLRVDLAIAFRARGDATESRLHAGRAADLAGRAGSERQHRRIRDLLNA
jgi:tetratricopeptide (TPR) repeat protein